MSDNAVELFQVLVEAGAIPGEDFSCNAADSTCRVTERAYRLLQERHPEYDWDRFSRIAKRDPHQAIQAINHHLGINFVDRILDRMTYRLGELPSERAAWYLKQILYGVEQKTGVPLYELLLESLNVHLCRYAETLMAEDAIAMPTGEWIGDLILAAGGSSDDFELQDQEVLLTEQGMRLLAEIWLGEFDLYAELAKSQD